MSDLQDLIHKTSMDCIERGKLVERERIIKLLDDLLISVNGAYPTDYGLAATLRQLIKGETNEEG